MPNREMISYAVDPNFSELRRGLQIQMNPKSSK